MLILKWFLTFRLIFFFVCLLFRDSKCLPISFLYFLEPKPVYIKISLRARRGLRRCITFQYHASKNSLLASATGWGRINSLSNYLRLRLYRIRVEEGLLHVSEHPAEMTYTTSFVSFLLIPQVLAVQTITAGSRLQQRNSCCARMGHRYVRKTQ